MAALHMIAAGDVRAAMSAYERAGALREAVALGAARLLPEDATLTSLRTRWAAQLAAGGQFETAAAQHLAGVHACLRPCGVGICARVSVSLCVSVWGPVAGGGVRNCPALSSDMVTDYVASVHHPARADVTYIHP
jgi:hypothetical protein